MSPTATGPKLPPQTVEPRAPAPFAPYALHEPQGDAIPLVCDSPHSGTRYPLDFDHALAFAQLRSGEDTDVDVLWGALPTVGATLIAAEFPRAYIDPNREPADIDPELLSAPWPGPVAPSEKTRLGVGLIWRLAGHGEASPIYDRKLSPAEVQARIDHYYRPYHAVLAERIEQAYSRFGALWHLNLHSMPANAYERLKLAHEHPLADFVLGDRDGSTCAPEFVDMVAQALRSRGYRVAINDPFKGVAVIARIGRPAERRHSLQIEVHRGLYMDEATRARSAGFARLRADLDGAAADIARYIREQVK
ncbi:MAG: N-formylglutamate amidohydrolase [Burkholderiaceae bacterium]|nr:N-formylglutamate amidohydrolase [Burkholderiaceae bacterium]